METDDVGNITVNAFVEVEDDPEKQDVRYLLKHSDEARAAGKEFMQLMKARGWVKPDGAAAEFLHVSTGLYRKETGEYYIKLSATPLLQ